MTPAAVSCHPGVFLCWPAAWPPSSCCEQAGALPRRQVQQKVMPPGTKLLILRNQFLTGTTRALMVSFPVHTGQTGRHFTASTKSPHSRRPAGLSPAPPGSLAGEPPTTSGCGWAPVVIPCFQVPAGFSRPTKVHVGVWSREEAANQQSP